MLNFEKQYFEVFKKAIMLKFMIQKLKVNNFLYNNFVSAINSRQNKIY